MAAHPAIVDEPLIVEAWTGQAWSSAPGPARARRRERRLDPRARGRERVRGPVRPLSPRRAGSGPTRWTSCAPSPRARRGHRPIPRRGGDPPPGAARPAHRAAQPRRCSLDRLDHALAPRARGGDDARRALPRPRPLQARQRQPRPRRGRRAARATSATRLRGRAPRAATRSRASAATSSSSSARTSRRRRGGGRPSPSASAQRSRSRSCSTATEDFVAREHRHRRGATAGARRAEDLAPRRRRRDVPGQGARPRPHRGLRRRHARDASADRLRIENDLRRALDDDELRVALPADRRPRDGARRRRRGAGALAAPRARAAAARRVHPGRRGDRADRPDRRVGARRGLPPGGGVARRPPGSRPICVSVNLSPRQVAQPDLAAPWPTVARGDRARARRCCTLEITESVLMDDAEAASQTLDAPARPRRPARARRLRHRLLVARLPQALPGRRR